jgi:hypothetical protein
MTVWLTAQSTLLDLQREDWGGRFAQPNQPCLVTVRHGILNQIYYPRVDQACTYDPSLIVQ